MRRFLLAGVATAAIASASSPAWAVFGVEDTVICQNCDEEIASVLRQAQTIAEWGKQLQAMEQQYTQLANTYYALAHVTDLGSAVSALGTLGIQNPLPVNPSSVQGLLNGTGGASGMLSSLTSLFNSTRSANQVYQVPGDSWLAQQINANGSGLAGAQSVALQLYQSAAQRIPLLNQLQSLINTSSDPSTREALIARMGAEQAYIQNANVQANALGNYMQAQIQVQQQQGSEKMEKDIDAVIADATAHGY